MRTATHVYLRVTEGDWCYSRPIRVMPHAEFWDYLRCRFVQEGFDLTRPIKRMEPLPGFDVIFSQPLDEPCHAPDCAVALNARHGCSCGAEERRSEGRLPEQPTEQWLSEVGRGFSLTGECRIPERDDWWVPAGGLFAIMGVGYGEVDMEEGNDTEKFEKRRWILVRNARDKFAQ